MGLVGDAPPSSTKTLARQRFPPPGHPQSAAAETKERILSNAHELFSQLSVRDAGVNELIGLSGLPSQPFTGMFPRRTTSSWQSWPFATRSESPKSSPRPGLPLAQLLGLSRIRLYTAVASRGYGR
jgi:hypothetical protein